MHDARNRLLVSPDAAARLDAVRAWLAALPRDAEALIVAASTHAADDLVRFEGAASGTRFGVARFTLDRLAATLAAPALAAAGRAPATPLSFAAVVARAVHQTLAEGALAYFAPVAARPGFAATIARTLEEARMNRVTPELLRTLPQRGDDLAALAERIERELEAAALADRARLFETAARVIADASAPIGTPLLLLDVPIASMAEQALVAALATCAPAVLAVAPEGDRATIMRLERALGAPPERRPSNDGPAPLIALKECLFDEARSGATPPGEAVTLGSWPGEARECVEIARRALAEAACGVPFDRMAVLLRSPAEYRSHLEEAFHRAEVPAFFARGTTQPDRAGRALLALLACRAEGLSARRFAEYVSLAQVPDPGDATETAWVAPDHDLVPAAVAAAAPAGPPYAPDDPLPADLDRAAVVDGTLRSPWRWERLLVDAAVIGGKERWARRLAGLEQELKLRRKAVDDLDEGRVQSLDRQLRDLEHLRAFAVPLIARLESLPHSGRWSEWLAHLRELAEATLRSPQRVLEVLAELAPMGPVGPVELDEVQRVLAPRLRDLALRPVVARYGALFVGPTEAARGLSFDVVFVPGLAEKLLPRKVVEDPVLPDAQRERLDAGMLTQADRVAAERLALRLAVGAARQRVHLSYPRLDVEQGRARVPSFYGLEALRAIEGEVLGFDDLARRAESAVTARLGWPAPAHPADAIDEIEYDLALLAPLRDADEDDTHGAATYLLGANPHLARALRARARRWRRRWTSADGFVDASREGIAALARHRIDARSYSPTALQHFSDCPYRFFLQAVHRLAPRDEAVALETIDPLTKGALFHEAQYGALTRMREAGLLPLAPGELARAIAIVDTSLDEVAALYEDRLAPAIPRVWEDGIAAIRADLREWLRRMAEIDDGWVPHRFELSFGIHDRDRPNADPASVEEPVEIAGGLRLRGAVDLVERHAHGGVRVTDHKTGRARAKEGFVIGAGKFLQPLLYALACERLLGQPVESGRLYYCTADGGFATREVRIDDTSREAAAEAIGIVAGALDVGFLPASPDEDACKWCDYRAVCGPHEATRTKRKPSQRTADLKRLRGMP